MSGLDSRRWPRLRIVSVADGTARFRWRDRAISLSVLDLSPGGVSLETCPETELPDPGTDLPVEIRFRGQRPGRVLARVVHRERERLGLAWDPPSPECWDGKERRARERLAMVPEHPLPARIPHPHVRALWAQVRILDANGDRCLRLEAVGGPLYLLPGMEVGLHLDLPVVHQHPIPIQILREDFPAQGPMRLAVRILDLECDGTRALEEWLALSRQETPGRLRELGFPPAALPGEHRFRQAANPAEREGVQSLQRTLRDQGLRTGFECLESTPPVSGVELGAWDGEHLVAGLTLELDPQARWPGVADDAAVLAGFGALGPWFSENLLEGLWELLLRHFLSSGRPALWVWCPLGRERLFRALGFLPGNGAPPSEGAGEWLRLERRKVLHGVGMPPVSWGLCYREISGFALRRMGRSIPASFPRLWRLAAHALFADAFAPRRRRQMEEDLSVWVRDARPPLPPI